MTGTNWGQIAATATLTLLPALLFLGLVQRHIVAGADGVPADHTNAFDRVFIGTVIFVALHLLWMRFLEAHIPLYVATALSLLIGAAIVVRG